MGKPNGAHLVDLAEIVQERGGEEVVVPRSRRAKEFVDSAEVGLVVVWQPAEGIGLAIRQDTRQDRVAVLGRNGTEGGQALMESMTRGSEHYNRWRIKSDCSGANSSVVIEELKRPPRKKIRKRMTNP